ncbi:diguanylate cyclase [Polymorphobacter sp. PAMC 29334]|uniref:diguanylate cyclase n=1 Tax=Polymorphobacter sp. PAMC 29334 TaxID=2862331 RepID=UPI001C7901CA|nr:diguanylate cyclase [Polymorphobacter sp. PAMC 29334]QYE34772.1 diguanylate cyclase [Polymorphobacter sp. PAMC 29334]
MENGSSATLVALSISVAVFGSFTALNLAGRIATAEASARRWWIFAAATALGGGTWAMHFVGMLAMDLPAVYGVNLTLVSFLLPIVVSGIGLHVVARFPGNRVALACSGLFVGCGVATMHYTGMAAMKIPGVLVRYDERLVAASIGIAIAAATLALWLAFRARGSFQRLVAAVVMGAAISGMHYTGMAAAEFVVTHQPAAVAGPVIPRAVVAFIVSGAATFLLLLALVTAFFDRKLAALTIHEVEALKESETRYRLLIENASDVIGVLDSNGRFVYESSSALSVLGYATDEIIGRHLTDFVPVDSRDAAQRFLGRVFERRDGPATSELLLFQKSGDRRVFEVVATNLLDTPPISGIVVNLRDITERTQLVAQLEALSETDLLTETLNRRGFGRCAERDFERARRDGEMLTIVMMDLDHFKRVNDLYGHAAGDLVLAKVASACAAEIRGGDLLGRMGGEEFALLLAGGDMAAAIQIVDRLRTLVSACTVSTIRGYVSVTASFGIAHVSPPISELSDALSLADEALYEAKNAGRDCIRIRA